MAPPPAPTCAIEDRGNGVLVYRHKQGYEARLRNNPDIKDKMCKIGIREFDHQNNSYEIQLLDSSNQIETNIFCNEGSANCNVAVFFENWIVAYSIRKSAEREVIETSKRVTDFLKYSIVARNYPTPTEGAR